MPPPKPPIGSRIHPDYLERKLLLAAKSQEHFESVLSTHHDRLTGLDRCLDRFRAAIAALRTGHTGVALTALDECHNELCVAEELVLLGETRFSPIEYEPHLPVGEQRIDFRATNSRAVWFVEVKTIHPELRDRWDQYQQIVQAGHISDNVTVHLERGAMGGELWHHKFAARSKMLEYSRELEERIRDTGVDSPQHEFVLALFSDGFAWHEDELEDFVAFYRSGWHREDDGLAKMELHTLAGTGKPLTRRISAFAYFCRPAFSVVPTAKNWNVLPPSSLW